MGNMSSKLGDLYKEILDMLDTSHPKERLELLSKKYGEEDVRWMLNVVRDDVAQGVRFSDPEKIVREFLTKQK